MSTKRLAGRILSKLGRETALRGRKKKAVFPKQFRVVSFTFDDFPASAMENGARILESHNVRGTFYSALGLANMQRPVGRIPSQQEMLSLAGKGHEIACHTFNHLDCAFKPADQIRADCLRNQETAKALGDISLHNFAYPHGSFDPRSKSVISDLYETARTIEQGINSGSMDLALLKSVDLIVQEEKTSPLNWLEKLEHEGGWLIFNTHDVAASPSPIGCTMELLQTTLTKSIDMGFQVLTIRQASALCRRKAVAPDSL